MSLPSASRLLALLAVVASPLTAQEIISPASVDPKGLSRTPGLHFLLDGAFEMGGDLFLTVTFTDGSEQKIYGGQGGTFGGGIEYRFSREPRLALGATLGYKFVTTAADDANITFTRVPIEATARWSLNDSWWVAGGLVMHTAIAFNGDGFEPDFTLPSATGFTAELGWKWIGVTYTGITYEDNGAELNAGSAGVSLRWVFGAKR